IQRNKRCLVSHSEEALKKFDPASQAMLAISISNLLLTFPSGIFSLFHVLGYVGSVVVQMLYTSHYIINPLVFIWFNQMYRNKILDRLKPGRSQTDTQMETVGPYYESTTLGHTRK
ncbi:hypothetical protein SK128_013594, partial [Halocaridina rubra]